MLDKYFPLYITSFFFSFLFTFLIEKILIPALTKKAEQPIYAEGPKWHLSKKGTPTMGGLAFVLSITFSLLCGALILFITKDLNGVLSLVICQIYAISNALVGIIDDAKKLKKKKNQGLKAREKLIMQFIFACLFLLARYYLLNDTTEISFSFGDVDLGIFYYPISIIILLGIINCANLTDGVDGLASSVAFSIGVSLLYISSALSTDASVISSAIIGASLGFLIFNLHPARIFMGDTGSLYFGALIASCAFSLRNPLLIIFIAGVYVLEGCSVIIQVVIYKLTKKRVFKMAPLHHHLEKIGWSENKICIVAILLTFIFSIPVYMFYLP